MKSVRLQAVGDIEIEHDVAHIRDDIENLLRGAHLCSGNLEMVLSTRNLFSITGYPSKANPKFASFLNDLNFRVLSVSNNKTYDAGDQGLLDTLEALEKQQIKAVGAGVTEEEAKRPSIFNLNGLHIAFFAFTSCYWQGCEARSNKPGLNTLAIDVSYHKETQPTPGLPLYAKTSSSKKDLEDLVKRVSEAKKSSDFIVVLAHWGLTNRYELADYQREIAHVLVDAGADLILGTHPHIVQAVERYKGKLIFYSLGNFIFEHVISSKSHNPALWRRTFRESIIVEVPLEGENVGKSVIRPIFLDESGFPKMANQKEADYLLDIIQYLSRQEKTELEIDSTERQGFV